MTLNPSNPGSTPPAAPETWFVVKTPHGTCEIWPSLPEKMVNGDPASEAGPHWGPYASRNEAIARRIGLIRRGKCRPV